MQVYRNYPFERISKAALNILLRSVQGVSKSMRKSVPVVLKALECYLAVTGQHLFETSTGRIRLGRIRNGFLGAIYSDRFLSATNERRYIYATIWAQIANQVSVDFGLDVRTIAISSTQVHPKLLEAAQHFDQTELIEDQVTIWQAWPCVSLSGSWSWIPLRSVFCSHGPEVSEKLHLSCSRYLSTRRSDAIPLISEFAEFLGLHWKKSIDELGESYAADEFFRKFLLYVVDSTKSSRQYVVLRDRWVTFVDFATNYLCAQGLFALPASGFANLPNEVKNTNIRVNADGAMVNTKLLLDVPLQITDQAALDYLQVRLNEEILTITRWAEHRANELWSNYVRFKAAAESGIAATHGKSTLESNNVRSLVDRSNPNWFENCAATFMATGFFPLASDSLMKALYPRPLDDLAYRFGLPITGSLVPHLAILVINHPELTPSLLEKLELYDEFGHECLVHQVGEKRILSGVKMRRGANRAEQTIVLNDRSRDIIEQVIVLTTPLRQYLRAVGDPHWRRLFLSSGRGFAYPRVLKISELTSSPIRVTATAHEICHVTGRDLEAAIRTARRFSLPRLRASVAIVQYIKEPDIGQLSKRLGHSEVDLKLLRAYLPVPLLKFFEERWIRLFQCGLLCEALKDNKWCLPATGFTSDSELDEFMMNHRLPLKPAALATTEGAIPDTPSFSQASTDEGEVLFNINPEVLAVLLKLVKSKREAVVQMSGTELYWATFGEHVLHEIQVGNIPRENLLVSLAEAESLISGAFYGSLSVG